MNNPAVFFLDKKDGRTFSFPIKETEKKLNIIKPTAFYVFNNQPYILFFDLVNEYNYSREKEIHKQVWSFDQSPLIFVIKEGDIQIFNAFAYDKVQGRLQKVQLKNTTQLKELFSFWNLQSGAIWSWLQENYYKNKIQKKRVNQKLFENIKLVREILTNRDIEDYLSEDDANILILRLIFIRYLIDRNVKIDPAFINGTSISERRKYFADLIEKPRKLNEFFEKMNEKFNGVLFKNTKINLSRFQAQSLALVFDGERPTTGTLFENAEFYFEIFDFSIIPVEVISGIYESLIDEETRKLHSAVYTPSFLVEYVLSNTVDDFFRTKTNQNKSECVVFDPSVGSGIFLVQAFRRMVDKEIELQKNLKINKVRLREIAQNNLFGIDVNEQALKVTCFSIYIAMLDYQDPKTILDNFDFPKLIDENLFHANFFDTNHQFNEVVKLKALDFILGNPPWKSDKEITHTNWLNDNNKITGRYEIAQSFLLRSKDFMLAKTVAGLITTSTIFYNISKPTKKFKQNFLTQFCLDSFFDLSPVRRLIFEEKNNPCAIVFYRLSDGETHTKNIVRHLSVKYSAFLKYYKTLVIERFDQKRIQQKHFIENDWMFKVALYGNALDFIFLNKLEENNRKIIDLIDDKIIFKGAGIKSNQKGNVYSNFLVGLPIIENSEVSEYYTPVTSEHRKLSKPEVRYESGRKIELFVGSKILIKEQARNESDIVVSYLDKDCVYKNGIWGISSKDDNVIKLLYPYLISKLYTYYIYITSCSWGVSTRPQIRFEEEYLSFPYIAPDTQTQIALIHLANEFLKPLINSDSDPFFNNFRQNNSILDQINQTINELYQIKDYEKDLIDYVFEISRYQFQESKFSKIIRRVDCDIPVLEKYATIFLNEFKDVYEDEYIHVDVYPLASFVAMNFVFSDKKPERVIRIINNDEKINETRVFDSIVKSTSVSEISTNLYIQKDIKGFEENSFYIIKPNEYKCWHPAIAWYDVSDMKGAIQSAELERLNKTESDSR